MADEHIDPEIAIISETTGLETDQIESLRKGFEGFDKEGTDSISETSMQMILKSMGVKSEKDDFHNAAMVVDADSSGQFSLAQFCSVRLLDIKIYPSTLTYLDCGNIHD